MDRITATPPVDSHGLVAGGCDLSIGSVGISLKTLTFVTVLRRDAGGDLVVEDATGNIEVLADYEVGLPPSREACVTPLPPEIVHALRHR